MLSINHRGHRLLDLATGEEEELVVSPEFQPLAFALVAAEYEGKYLFILDSRKLRWELPGGMIAPGETPRACAQRELLAETRQELVALRFIGILRFELFPIQHLEYGALYAGELAPPTKLEPTEEALDVRFWNLETNLPDVDALDHAIAVLASGHRTPKV